MFYNVAGARARQAVGGVSEPTTDAANATRPPSAGQTDLMERDSA
ncbi:MAG TPA: hypothetical protein VID72_02230 [Ktedonobacterales bacterium]